MGQTAKCSESGCDEPINSKGKCKRHYMAAYYRDHKAEMNTAGRAYYEANREHLSAQAREYRIANKEQVESKKREWYEANKDHVRTKSQAYYEANREKVAAWNRQYQLDNRDKIREKWQAWYYEHQDEQKAKMRAKYQIEKKERAAKDREKTYGLTQEAFDALLFAQDGRCAICRSEKPGGRGGFAVDHCHTAGHVRGLLCVNCNNGLGRFKDDPVRLLAAADYLSR
jgi:hypothetical protein